MKKTNYILTATLCLALTGLTGCSAPNTEEDSEPSSVIQLLKDAARKLPGSAGDMAELLFAEDTKAAAKESEQAAAHEAFLFFNLSVEEGHVSDEESERTESSRKE